MMLINSFVTFVSLSCCFQWKMRKLNTKYFELFESTERGFAIGIAVVTELHVMARDETAH